MIKVEEKKSRKKKKSKESMKEQNEAVRIDDVPRHMAASGIVLTNKDIDALGRSTRERGVQEISVDEFQDFLRKMQMIWADREMNVREKGSAIAEIIEAVGER